MIRILKYGETPTSELLLRGIPEADVRAVVSEILSDVRQNGDSALFAYAKKFDHISLSSLEVTREEIDAALQAVDPAFLSVLRRAADNIRAFHEKQRRTGFVTDAGNGIVLGQKVIPIARAGLYVPGGTAAYPSTVLMDAIPALLAPCEEVVIVTPPDRSGSVAPAILAAAEVAGVHRIFKVGGAQAIAALAYGTESIPKADKIVGPGNAFVAEAKRQVYGEVSIDMIAGPSEVLIVADGRSEAKHVAADMLAQAEHDRMATAVLVTDSPALAMAVRGEIEAQLPSLEREEIARASIEGSGKIILVEDLDAAVELANELAPEHLELCVDEPFNYLGRVKNAGSVFLGRNCPEALGDYLAGPNHTLPTGGRARFSSPLSVDDFVKKTQFLYYSKDALGAAAEDVALFARQEGLTAHARSVLIRSEE